MNKNAKEEPAKVNDHGCDMVRYGAMSRPETPRHADVSAKKREQATLSGSVQRELHELKQKGKNTDQWKDYEYGKDTFYDDPF